MKRSRLPSGLLSLLCLLACDVESTYGDAFEAPSRDDAFRDGPTAFSAEELYLALRDLSDAYPLPEESSVIEVGTYDPQTGDFDGLESIAPYYDYELGIFVPGHPATRSIAGVRAILRFRAVGNAALHVRVNGVNRYKPAGVTHLDVDVAHASEVSWQVGQGVNVHADELLIRRPDVNGAGAFQVEAWPVGLLYEPPTNEAKTNQASFTHVGQTSSSTSVGRSEETSSFVDVPSLANRIHQLADKASGAHPAIAFASHIDSLIGTVHTKITGGSSVSSDNTLSVSTSELLSVSTNADLGPGRGDVIVYLVNPRLAWVMVEGRVTVTLIDYEKAEYRAVSQLRTDLLALRRGGTPLHTNLSETTLESLLELDPFFEGEGAPLPSTRFEPVQTLTVGGANVTMSLSHTRTSSDAVARSIFQGRIVETQEGWLGRIGLGIESNGQYTTKVTQRASTTSASGEVTQAEFALGALPNEHYTVEAYYDRVFGTFALRRPSACPFFDPLHPDPSFCSDPACPCEEGTGGCSGDGDCTDGLICGAGLGERVGLPASFGVCVAQIGCPEFNPQLPNSNLCSAECRCAIGQGHCEADDECSGIAVCGDGNGQAFGLPQGWNACRGPGPVWGGGGGIVMDW